MTFRKRTRRLSEKYRLSQIISSSFHLQKKLGTKLFHYCEVSLVSSENFTFKCNDKKYALQLYPFYILIPINFWNSLLSEDQIERKIVMAYVM